MSEIDKKGDEIFRNFNLTEKSDLSRPREYANYLIGQIDLGNLAVGSKLPSVNDLHLKSSLSHANIREALKIMECKGYLSITSGINSCVKRPDLNPYLPVQYEEVFHADYHCKHPKLHTIGIEKLYQKFRIDYSRETPPGQENSISPILINTLLNRYNVLHRQSYHCENLYYTHDYQLLIKSIGLVVKEKGSVVAISAQSDGVLRLALASAGLKMVEVKMDKDGLCTDDLARICLSRKVAAVFLTSKASFPEFIYTTAERVNELFALQKTYQFKIIENDFYAPWLNTLDNLVLELAGDAVDAVIYLWPVSYLLSDISRLMVIAAHSKIIEAVRNKVKAEGKQAYRSIGNATNDLLLRKEFIKVQDLVKSELSVLRAIVLEVFSSSDFWQLAGIESDSGPAFFMKPSEGSFPAGAYQQLRDLGVFVYDPESYNGSALNGIRYDFSFYIGKKNFKITLQKIEKHSRNIVLLSRGMEPVKV